MNYGELRSYFLDILNRDDITDNQADTFIGLGLRRTERVLRTSLQKSKATQTFVEGGTTTMPLPNDYLGLVLLKVNDQPIFRASPNVYNYKGPGIASEFTIEHGVINFLPQINPGDVAELTYFAEFQQTTSPSAYTKVTSIIPDVVIYAALWYAADTFTDVRKADFDASFRTLVSEVQAFSDQDDLTGAAVVNPYAGLV